MKTEAVIVPNSSGVAPKPRKLRHQREVEDLIRQMSDSSADLKDNAALQVSCYKPEVAKIALPKLFELLGDSEERVVVAALTSIGVIGSEVEMQRDNLLKVVQYLGDEKFKHPSSSYASGVQYNAAYTIAYIGPNAKSVVKEFVEQIEKIISKGNFDLDLIKFAILGVAMIGKDALDARPLLMRFKNGEIKSQWALSEIMENVNLALAMIEANEDQAAAYLADWVKSNKYIDEPDDWDELKNVALHSQCGVNLLNRVLNEDISSKAKKAIISALKRARKSSSS